MEMNLMPVRGIRGATVAPRNDEAAILDATSHLLKAILASNPALQPADVASAFFTVTNDLDAAYPATVIRQMSGWSRVPMLCAQEIPVPGGQARCIRVLIHWNTDCSQAEIRHQYLGPAAALRPDLAGDA
jgi:chorismate mutase